MKPDGLSPQKRFDVLKYHPAVTTQVNCRLRGNEFQLKRLFGLKKRKTADSYDNLTVPMTMTEAGNFSEDERKNETFFDNELNNNTSADLEKKSNEPSYNLTEPELYQLEIKKKKGSHKIAKPSAEHLLKRPLPSWLTLKRRPNKQNVSTSTMTEAIPTTSSTLFTRNITKTTQQMNHIVIHINQ